MLNWKVGEFLTQNPGTSGPGNCLVTLLYWEVSETNLIKTFSSGDIQLVGPVARNWTKDFWMSYCDLSKLRHKFAEIWHRSGFDEILCVPYTTGWYYKESVRTCVNTRRAGNIRKTRFTSTPPRMVAQKAHLFPFSFKGFPVEIL